MAISPIHVFPASGVPKMTLSFPSVQECPCVLSPEHVGNDLCEAGC